MNVYAKKMNVYAITQVTVITVTNHPDKSSNGDLLTNHRPGKSSNGDNSNRSPPVRSDGLKSNSSSPGKSGNGGTVKVTTLFL